MNHAFEGGVGAIPNYMGHLIQLLRVCLLGRDFTKSWLLYHIHWALNLILTVGRAISYGWEIVYLVFGWP